VDNDVVTVAVRRVIDGFLVSTGLGLAAEMLIVEILVDDTAGLVFGASFADEVEAVGAAVRRSVALTASLGFIFPIPSLGLTVAPTGLPATKGQRA
jgi:hypothetical protein